MAAGGSHPLAAMMPDPWATYRCSSAEEGQPANNAPLETTSCVPANQGTFMLAKGFHGARSRSATRTVETRNMVDEALDSYVKTRGRDGAQKRQELHEQEARRTETKSGALGNTRKGSATPPGQEGASVGTSDARRRRTSRETSHTRWCTVAMWMRKAYRNGQTRCSLRSREPSAKLEAREGKWMESEDSNAQRRRAWEKLWEPGAFSSSPYLSSLQR